VMKLTESTVATKDDLDYNLFQKHVKEKTGIDLTSYRRPQMERRLRALAEQYGASNLFSYSKLLDRSPEMMEVLLKRITINVSECFRNLDKFEELKREILPALLAKWRRISIWSAGCSYGAEAYSLAILLRELGTDRVRARILATDIDQEMLERCRQGLFSEADMKNVDAVRRRQFFTVSEDSYRANDDLRQFVELRYHDLLKDNFDHGFQLILCRNVVIYFTDDAKINLYRRFFNSLEPGGILLTGGTEQIRDARKIGFESISPFFYRKPTLRIREEA